MLSRGQSYNKDMEAKVCQSCGMPLNRDPKHGGSNSDGTKSSEYCSYCYQNGTWMMDMSVDEMQRKVGGILKQFGAPETVQRDAMSGIPSLKRWKK
jgi:hypothetical protein